MAKTDQQLQIEAEKQFPGDRRRQDAYIKAMTAAPAASTAKKRASTTKKKTVRKVAPAKTRRRRF